MESINTHSITRNGLEYTVSLYMDEGAESPRDWSNAAQFYIYGGRGDVYVDELEEAGEAGRALAHFLELYGRNDADRVQRAFRLWAVITASTYTLHTGSGNGYMQSHWHEYYALMDESMWRGPYASNTFTDAVEGEAKAYETWAYGDVLYYFITGPDGADVGYPVGGFYSEEEAVEDATSQIDADATQRTDEANTAGAGIVGVI